ncbi:delta-aminolevulinic acid dehydratase [Acidobacteriota bacterium]
MRENLPDSTLLFSLDRLIEYIEKENYKGYDPYDALRSPLLKAVTCHKYMRIAVIQLLKRLPLNLRPFLGIRKGYNPKGIGLLLWSYTKLFEKTQNTIYSKKVYELLDLLKKQESEGYSGKCWGYNFDWQSRAFYLPRYTPTIVNTAFIGHALIDTYEAFAMSDALEMALSIKDFIINDVNKRVENSFICFSYSPIDNTFVHNANLLGASFLIRINRYISSPEIKKLSLASLGYSMKYQRKDGAWYYAESESQNWIDSFHTGFNLQSIQYFFDEGFGLEYQSAFERGVNYYQNYFFLPNGIPKYYHNKLYPIDIHSAAQAVIFFSHRGEEHKRLAEKVLVWMIKNMQDKEGFFYFQKRRLYTSKISYMRWSQAWALLALVSWYVNNAE